jgi:hypothetical protein
MFAVKGRRATPQGSLDLSTTSTRRIVFPDYLLSPITPRTAHITLILSRTNISRRLRICLHRLPGRIVPPKRRASLQHENYGSPCRIADYGARMPTVVLMASNGSETRNIWRTYQYHGRCVSVTCTKSIQMSVGCVQQR